MKQTKKLTTLILTVLMLLSAVELNMFSRIGLGIFVQAAISGYFTYSVTNNETIITDVNTTISGNVVIPSTLGNYPITKIADYAFQHCDSIENVSFDADCKLTNIGIWAFYKCINLKSIKIPDTVTHIGQSAFLDCDNLLDVYYGGSEEKWQSIVIRDGNENLINANIHYNYHITTDHNYTPVSTTPTCTKQGYTTYTCACGDCHKTDYTDVIPHSFTHYVSDNNADCLSDGTKHAFCDYNCGTINRITDEGSKTEHPDENSDDYCDLDGTELYEHHKCMCHNKNLIVKKIIYPLACFFWKLFGTKQYCECGIAHY